MLNVPQLSSKRLCATFATEAEKIWEDLRNARGMGIIRDEEAVTNDLLLDAQIAHPAEIATFQFSKPEEKFTGADWEWWLTDNRKWLGLLIQAKILKAKSNRYSSIKHKVGKEKRPQIDILIEQAKWKGIDPLYFFYNHSRLGISSFQWNCESTTPVLQQLGCTIAHAASVQLAIRSGGAGLPKMNPFTLPLRCLVCCQVLAKQDTSLPGRAYGVTRFLRGLTGECDRLSVVDGPTLRDEPPSYVKSLLAMPLDDRAGVIEGLRSEIGPIGSLIVIREST